MAKKPNIHVTPQGNGQKGWKAAPAGGGAGSNHRTQAAAIKAGTKAAKSNSSELKIHGRNGQIRESNSHGNDQHPPKG